MADLGIPTVIDGVRDDVPVRRHDSANEKDAEVVLDCDQLRVVDPGLFGELLALHGHLDADRGEA